jgi:hypothetical protein
MLSQPTGEKSLARRVQTISDMVGLCKQHEASHRGKPFKLNKVEAADDTIPHRDIEEIKTVKPLPSLPSSAPISRRDQCPFCSLKTAFYRSTATDTMRESTHLGATYSKSISTRRHATTMAFEAFIMC